MDIVEELKRNPESGARRLEAEYKAGLMSLARRFCHDEGDAEELVNRTFAEVVEDIDGFLAQSSFFTWIVSILNNLHAMDCRRKSHQTVVYPGIVPDVADESAQDEIYRNIDATFVRDAVESLPKEMRDVVVMHFLMEQPIAKVAQFLSLPVSTVKWRLHIARKELARRLGATAENAAKKPGGKAVIIALLLCGLTALGAAVWHLAVPGEAQDPADAGMSLVASRVSSSEAETTGHATSDMRQAEDYVATQSAADCRRPSATENFNFSTDFSQGENMNITQTTRAAMLAAATVATSAAIPSTASAYTNTAERAVIPPNEIMTVEVAADIIWDKPVFVDGILRKTGAGKLTITGEKLYGHGRVEIAEGELAVTATGTGSAAIEAPAVLADAAMWLDASQHVAGPTGEAATGDAAKWFDVREENWATPSFSTNYIYAEGVTTLADNAAWPTIGTDEFSRPYVYFGGYGSGEYMVWKTPAGDKAWIEVFQSFAAYNPNGNHGHYIGATYDDTSPRNALYFAVNSGTAGWTIFAKDPNSLYNHLRNGRVFRNGERVSVSDAIELDAVQILETDSYPTGKPADAFFNYRDYQQKAGSFSNGNRVGGGRMHEFVVFTNRIDEIDRVLVSHWFLRKWVNVSGYGSLPAFDVSKGATLTLPGVVAGSAKVSSRGTFKSSGTAALGSAALSDPFAGIGGAAAFDESASTTNLAGAAVAAAPGRTYDVDAFNTVTVSAGAAGEVRKTGAGYLALAGIGNATSLAVAGGTASLRAMPAGSDTVLSPNCLADGGFEGIDTGSSGYVTFNNKKTIGAWTVTNFYSSAATRVLSNGTSAAAKALDTPEGSNYLFLKQGGGVRQSVSLPRSGRYEVTLRVSQRPGFSGFARIYLDGILIGTAQSPSGQTEWDFVRFETPWIEAGDHVLTMSSEVTVDTAIGLDDVQLRWLDDVRAVAIPNANFEDADWVGGVEQPANQTRITSAINDTVVLSSAFLTKWAVSGTVELLRGLPYLRSKSTFNAPGTDTGSTTAYLHKGSFISQSVTIPEDGLYALSTLASCYVPTSSYSGFANGSIILTLGEISETIAIDNWSLKRVGLSSAIRLSQGDVVTVKIAAESVSTTYNEILVDDVRLERLPNLVANPGFEDGTSGTYNYPYGWTVAANPASKKIVYDGTGSSEARDFGTSFAEGTHRARLHSGVVLSQAIPLIAGLYRLSFWDVSRVSNGKVYNGPSPIRVALAKGAVTNFCETVTSSLSCTEAMRREFLIRVTEAGNWTLSFEATATGDKSSFIDAVCLVPAEGLAANAIPVTGDKPDVTIAAEARLGLDWLGILEASRVKCAERSLKDGVTADLAPDSLYGIGAFHVSPLATTLIIR